MSLTRTAITAAVVGIVVAIVARELARPDFSRFMRRTGAIVLGGVAVVIGFIVIAPVYWKFLLKRFSEFTSGTQVMNWHVRVLRWDMVEQVVAKSGLLFGLGFPQPGSNPVDSHIWLWSSDMAWLPIMYRFGYLGLLLFGLLLAGYMARSLLLSLRPPELRRELALTYFIVLVMTVVMGFDNWTFMNPGVYPMGLWIFAAIAAESLRPSEQLESLVAPASQPPTAAGIDQRAHANSS